MGSPHGIRISRVRLAELKRVLEIERASFGEEAYTAAMFRQLFENCGDLFFVAKRSGRIAGYVATCAARGSAEIISIAVHPARRNAGIGTALMEHTRGALQRRGVRRLRLMVRAGNAEAIRFYRRFGFRRVRTVPRYYEDGGAGWRMERRL